MYFDLTEDQIMVRDMVRRFASEHIAPGAMHRDEDALFDRDLYVKLGELGLMGINVPEVYGGSELDFVSTALVIEEIARHDGSAALCLAGHNALCCAHILRSGTEDQKKAYLPRLSSGEHLGAWAFASPKKSTLTATKHTEGWVLEGVKKSISLGGVADVFVVLATTGATAEKESVSAFIVERNTA